jgi:sugar/nucleoside kinase (ribokinase family)
MASRVCVIGNTNLDLVMGLLPVWPEEGTETFLDRSDFRAGGSAANTAIVLQSLGCESGLVSALGSDALGDMLAAGFSGPLDRIARVPGQTGVSVGVLHPGAERSFLSFNGHLDAIDLPMILAALADWPLEGALALVSGAFAMPGLLADQDALLDHLRLAGAQIAIDPGWPGAGWTPAMRRKVDGWVRRVDHVLMNDKEIMGLTGAGTLADGISELAGRATNSVCLVAKTGRDGAILRQGDAVHRASAPEIEVFDTVGAGDAFNAGYLAAIATGASPDEALQSGVDVASRTIARFPRSGMS